MRSVVVRAVVYWQYFSKCSIFHGWCNFCPSSISRWQIPFFCHEAILQGPSQLGPSFPCEGSLVAPITFLKMRSPTQKSLCLTFKLQCLVIRFWYYANLCSAVALTSSTKSSYKRIASLFLLSLWFPTLQLMSSTSTGMTVSLSYAS